MRREEARREDKSRDKRGQRERERKIKKSDSVSSHYCV